MATDSATYEIFRRNVRLVMEYRGVTQLEMESRTGIAQSDLSRMLNGRREPLISRARRIADALDIELNLLFDPALTIESIPESSKLSA